MFRSRTTSHCASQASSPLAPPHPPRTWISPSSCSARPRSEPSCRRSSRRRSSTRPTGSTSRSRSGRRMPTGAVQFGRIQGRRQRSLMTVAWPTCAASRSLPVQPVRLLGSGRHQRARDQDAQGPRGQAARGRAQHHQLHHVRVAGPQQGVDRQVPVVNTATPGLLGFALADRADAVQIWEPAYTILLAKARASARSMRTAEKLESLRRRRHASPISGLPRTATGSSRTRR